MAALGDVDAELFVGEPAAELVQVSVGASFGQLDCDAFLRRRDAVIVSLLAGPEAGKTTLIATMYELARRRGYRDLRFAGSDSIRGFEERCHLSRHVSGAEHADTQRTRGGPPQFLHLRLAGQTRSFDFLLADRAGEFVTRVLAYPDSIATFPEVVRADHLLLLVDGSELFHRAPQANSTAKRVFQALEQNNLLGSRPLHIVVTKKDMFSGIELDKVEQRAQRLGEFFSERHRLVHLHLTGARARAGEAEFGEGIEELLQALLPREVAPMYVAVPTGLTTHLDDALSRFMDALGARV
ncbi:hypothetical protein [Lysobacter sp. Root916]|uniref:TRAFAC clade GTPase domain-containing protein n=1 Tax=Lysobacter sp. Root916 TaxID=1736606 RepID=UPI0012FB4DBC|nr:hypothetical protein [Lysobacter sp. Root916]